MNLKYNYQYENYLLKWRPVNLSIKTHILKYCVVAALGCILVKKLIIIIIYDNLN